MATVSSLVTVFLDPDSNEPLALSALGEGDVISERIGGTGRTDISGLVSSVGNVNISYNSTTRQFVVDEVSGVSAEVTFESVRDALASGSGELAFSGDFVISGGGKFRGDLSGNLSGTALSATNAIAVPGVTINGIALAANAGAFTTGDPTNESSVRAALASATAAVTLNNKNLSGVGEIRASVVSATTLSGNLSGVATRAEAVTGVVINSTSYNLSSGTNINISTTATVDFPSVSSAIFSATGPLFFNNQDTSGIRDLRASSLSSTTTVVAVGNITGGGLRTTGNLNVTGDSAFTGTIRGTTVSATTSLSSPAATITSFTGTDIRATNSVSAESFSATSGRISTLSALTSFSAPAINTGSLNATAGMNVTSTASFANSISVTGAISTTGVGAFGGGLNATGTITATDLRGTASVSAASVSAANTIDAPIVRTSNYFSGNLSGNAVSATYASAIDNVIINGTSVSLRSGQSTTIAATGTVSFSGVKNALEAATSGVGFNSQEISGISTGRFGDLRASASVSANSVSGLTGRFNTSVSTPTLEVSNVVNNIGGLVLSSLASYNTNIYGENVNLTTPVNGIILISNGRLEAPIVRSTNYFSGNLSGLATSADNARIIPGCLINGSAVSANASITIAAGSVDFTSVSGAIFTGTGPLTFNGKDLNGVEDISASGDLRASSVSATNVSGLTGRFNTSLSTPSFTGTTTNAGTLSVTSTSTFGNNISVNGANTTLDFTGASAAITLGGADAQISLTGANSHVSLLGAASYIDTRDLNSASIYNTGTVSSQGLTINGTSTFKNTVSVTANGLNVTGSSTFNNDLVSNTSIRAPSVSATTQFSAPNAVLTAATIGTASITTANITNNVNVTNDITAARVKATTEFSGVSATINGSATITGGLTTTSLQLNGPAAVTGTLTVNGTPTFGSQAIFNAGLKVATGNTIVEKAAFFGDNVSLSSANRSLNVTATGAKINVLDLSVLQDTQIDGDLYVDNDGSGYINYVSAGLLKVGGVTILGTAGGATVQEPVTFEDPASFTSDINVSGDLYVTSLAPTSTGNYVLTVSSGGSGLISTKKLVTGAVLPAGGAEPAFFDGSLIRYEQTGGYYQPAQYVRVTASDAGLELSQGVGISIADAGYVAIGGGGTLSVTGVSTLSSLLVPSSVSATTYLNVRPYVSSVDSATTTTVNMTGDYDMYLVNTTTTSVTLYLPDASAWNTKRITISKVDDGGSYRSVTVSGATLQTATNTVLLYDPTESVTVISNGTNWYSLDYDRSYGLVVVCKNSTGSTLTKGTPVRISGATGANILITPTSAINTAVPETPLVSLNRIVGVVEHDIPNNQFGHVLTKGILYKYNTNSFEEGDSLYLASGGGFTNIKPTSPYESIFLGIVTRKQTNNGSILIDVANAIHINDIVGMNLASSLVSGDLISYDLATSTFKNVQSIDISGTIKGGTVSATSYANLPYTSAIWYAGNMFSKNLESAAPASNGDLILYDQNNDYWAIYPSSIIAGAPTNAQYLTLAADATLTNERVLVANGGLSSNDGGAGGNFTVSANYASAIWNANKIQSTTVNSTAPSKSQNLQYVSTGEWKPNWNEVSTITATSVTLTTDIDHWFASAVNGPMNLTLPAANTCQGKQMSIIKVDTSGQVVTVSGGSITTILNRVKMRMPREQVELLSTGSEWLVLSHDRDYGGDTMDSDTNAVFDDFIQGSTETGEAGYAGWSFTNGSITALAATTFSGSMGAFRRASGTTANQVASFYPLNAGTNTTVLTEHCVEFKLRGRASTTGTDHTVQLGLTSDLTTITPANGFYFERAAASGTWAAVTRRASSERRIDTGITYQNSADPDTFRIFIKDLNNVQFYINDVLVANETNVSNTIPLAGIAVLPGFTITPTTTTARNFDVDYIAYTFDAIQERY